MRVCHTCKANKEDSYFYLHDAYTSKHCKECTLRRNKASADAHRRVITCYVYIITNPAWPGHVKIGRSTQPLVRLEQYQTYSPYRDFEMVYMKRISNIREVESLLYSEYGESHEWVCLGVEEAIKVIDGISKAI